MPTEFLNTTATHHTFALNCDCGYSAEAGLPKSHRALVECPDKCGALYFMRPAESLFDHPRLIQVAKSRTGQPQPVTSLLDLLDREDDPTLTQPAGANRVDAGIDDCGRMVDDAFAAEPGYYEQRMSEKLGVSVEQLRREMEEADEFGK
jgi:hypothetical protein